MLVSEFASGIKLRDTRKTFLFGVLGRGPQINSQFSFKELVPASSSIKVRLE